MSYVERCPPELWELILAFCPPSDLQRTTLSLLQALPRAPISLRLLYTHLSVGRPDQIWPLYKHLSSFPSARELVSEEDARPLSKSFWLRSWKGDADMVVNCLFQLPELRLISLAIGTNFAPEHLEDAFLLPRPPLETLLLRFRPYVDKASYHQFLAGSYFDSCLLALARWPLESNDDDSEEGEGLGRGRFKYLSIVQEVPPRHLVDSSAPNPMEGEVDLDPRRKEEERVKGRGRYTGHGPFPYLDERLQSAQPKIFAQPIVFFNTKCITTLSLSPLASSTTHLRLRIPLRDVVSSLVVDGAKGFPSLRFLDLSTSNLRLHTHLPSLLARYPDLKWLVVDHTNLFGFLGSDMAKGRECAREVGKMISMAGMGRGKEREREVGREEEVRWRGKHARRAELLREEENLDGEGREENNGVDEVADEFERLTTMEYDPNVRRTRRNVRSMAQSGFSLRSSTAISTNGSTTPHRSSQPLTPYHPTSIAFVLPSPPALESFCLGGEARLTAEQKQEWQREFEQGWKEGLGKLVEWAIKGVGERFERARRKAETDRREWERWTTRHLAPPNGAFNVRSTEEGTQSSSTKTVGRNGSTGAGKGKGKVSSTVAAPPPSPSQPLPPPKITLYRFPTPSETPLFVDGPTHGLLEVDPASDWRSVYTNLLEREASCRLCLVPLEREGPLRRGGNGEVEDLAAWDGEEGGSNGGHVEGCGHQVGRKVWDEDE